MKCPPAIRDNSLLLTIHVVSHTHWDREWYHPAERFRQRLVALIDDLLDDPPSAEHAFLLDGQTVVLEDYLAVRPERASELAAALRDGRLEAGPWFVLGDELIPGGEGLIRNLLAGRRALRALRAGAPRVLYCPDSFGHPAALPMIARGFDKPLVILWRGFGGAGAPKGDVFLWAGPTGDSVLLYHLPRSGYELGASLPTDEQASRARWQRIRDEMASRSTTGIELLLNGADHHARQRDLAAAIARLHDVATSDEVRRSSLSRFAADLEQRAAKATLPRARGELRDSYGHTWTLQGTLASRTPQKRRYVQRERELVRDVEPWLALAAIDRRPSRRPLLNAAWRELLLCQPHDTLCGCSIDQVARAMDHRLGSVASQAEGLREDAMLDAIGHDRDAAARADREAWLPILLVRNRAPRARSGVAIVTLTTWIADAPAGPGSARSAPSDSDLPPAPKVGYAGPLQVIDQTSAYERTEAPRAYPDNDAVARFEAALWVENVPAYGITAFPVGVPHAAPRGKVHPVAVARDAVSNGRMLLRFGADGMVTLDHGSRVLRNFVQWESRSDVGDLYTPAVRDSGLTPRLLGTHTLHRGPLRGSIEQHWRLLGREGRVDVRLRFILDAEAGWLRLHVVGDNAARDHRLRLRVRTGIEGALTFADAAFACVQREPVKDVPADVSRQEMPVRTAPLHRYVSHFNGAAGVTLFSDGLTEYESEDGTIIVTLLRSVGELSRSDLPERPGNAGWPAATPEAQNLGPFEAQLAVMLHGPRTPETIDEIERTADEVLYPLAGGTLRSALRMPTPKHGIALEGSGLAFSCAKESEDGEWIVLRCVNLLDEEGSGSWRLGRPLREAQLARLDETPTGKAILVGDTVTFVAPPRAVVTILVR